MITADLQSYYRYHSKVYDYTRWSFLFGRDELINRLPELPHDARILDVGCGTGYHLMRLAELYPKAELTGIDLSADMLDVFSSKLNEHLNIDLLNQHYSQELFPGKHFDLVICSYSLTMIENPEQSILWIKEHLKPGAFFSIVDFWQTNMRWFERWMGANHVNFDQVIEDTVRNEFNVLTSIESEAFRGLWSYNLVIAQKDY